MSAYRESASPLKEELRILILEIVAIDGVDEISEEMMLDSLAVIEIAGAVERQYKITIDDMELRRMGTLNNCHQLVQEKLAREIVR